jgi:hypothetical protein
MTTDVVAGFHTAEPTLAGVMRAAAGVRGSEYAELGRHVTCASRLDRRPGWYSVRIAVNLGLLGGALGSYRQVLRYLHSVGALLRHPIAEKRLVTTRDAVGVAPRLPGSQGA